MSKKRKIVLTIFIAVFVAAGALYMMLVVQQNRVSRVSREESFSSEESAQTETFGETVIYDGKTYRRNHSVRAILFLGVDMEKAHIDSIADFGRADALFLLVQNDKTKETTVLEISRDTMADVSLYDDAGNYVSTGQMQINMQYAFGEDHRRACWMTKNAVSKMLYGAYIDSTFALVQDGIPAAADALGGLEVTLTADATDLDPAYTKGSRIVLTSENVEAFLRYRDAETSGSNEQRIARQEMFLSALWDYLKENGASKINAIEKAAENSIYTDLTVEELAALSESSDTLEFLKLAGKSTVGDLHDEYYLDEEAVKKQVLFLFYEEE